MNTCPVPMYQDSGEFARLMEIYRGLKPRMVLEVGSLYGGTLWHWISGCQPHGMVVSVDMIVPTADHRYEDIMAGRAQWGEWANASRVGLLSIQGDSTRPDTFHAVAMLGSPFDFIFIDGGHDYRTVESDFLLYYPLLRRGGVMAFHDIAYPDVNIDRIDVGRFWRERIWAEQRKYSAEAILMREDNTWGIGVVYR